MELSQESNVIVVKDKELAGVQEDDDDGIENVEDENSSFQFFGISSIVDVNPSIAMESLNVQISDFQKSTIAYIAGFVERQI